MGDLDDALEVFRTEVNFSGKGPLCVALVVTRAAKIEGLPLEPSTLLSPRGGQVKGLGAASVQKILADHGIDRMLAKEGGRTSRGSIDHMKKYVEFLNGIANHPNFNVDAIESWWVKRVQEYFASDPLKIRLDMSKSFAALIDDLLSSALERQKVSRGYMVQGAVMQHLVGAKLEMLFPEKEITHSGFAVADQQSGRHGDFIVGDTVIHVSSSPSPNLLQKCRDNLNSNRRPLIITNHLGVGGARANALELNIDDRVDVLELSQFLTTNVFEWTAFETGNRLERITALFEAYNRIVETQETDHSLKIHLTT